jgi:hypothetical protein
MVPSVIYQSNLKLPFAPMIFRFWRSPLESYIVRIYRRDHEKPVEIAGVVESIEAEKKQSFQNMDELSRILCGPEKTTSSKRKKPAQNFKTK